MKKVNKNSFKADIPFDIKLSRTFYDIDASKKKLEKELEEVRVRLGKLQDVMYAHGKYNVLVCLQGMDTAGKDSLIREVFKDFNTRGIVVHSFKKPSSKELKHDFLWRHYLALPERGKFSVFNRTHYENVLVTRVHPEYILYENIPSVSSVDDIDEAFWNSRFDAINTFEKHLRANGTIIFKFFLNLSKDEQKNRLLRRIDLQEKNWKFSPSDLKERQYWDDYQDCYEKAINATNTDWAPWYAIPADDKPTARYIVAKTIYDTLKEFDEIDEPVLSDEIKAELDQYKAQLEAE